MRITRGVLGPASLCLSLVSCGAPEGEGADALATVPQAVLSGTTDITESYWPQNYINPPGWHQAEADAIVTASGYRYVTYNNEDPGYINYFGTGASQYRVACRGATMMGYSLYKPSTGTWTVAQVFVGSSYAMLWGDPAISVIPGTDRVFLSNLASPTTKFDAAVNVFGSECEGLPCCNFGSSGIRNGGSNYPAGIEDTGALAGACIARATAPNPFFTVSAGDCVSSGNDFYDGGSLAGSGIYMYAAYWNTTRGRIDVYRATSTSSWSQMQIPFPNKGITAHPLLVNSAANSVYLLGREGGGTLWITEFANGGSTWTPPVQVATNVNSMGHSVTLKDGTEVRARGYTAASSVFGEVDIFYQTPGTPPRTKLKGARCSGAPLVCNPLTGGTSSSHDSFMPVLGIAYSSGFVPLKRLTFWANNNLSGAQVRMRVWDYVNGTITYATPAQTACPDLRRYWGDYDGMFATGSGTSNATLWRALTDSTSVSCVHHQYRATPQHVSLLAIPL